MNDQNNSKTEIHIQPVGFVKSELKEMTLRPDVDIEPEIRKEQTRSYHQRIKKVVSELIIHPEFEELLDGIEAFSHIMVLFWPHLMPEDRRRLKKVHPMGRRDIPLQGIFATRSPARPNPILVSSVPLLERQKNTLRVKGLEALDGSPIVDIKPVTRLNDGIESPTVPEWIRQIHKNLKSN
jgi:tRNA (adenine37-N6)-methyltransferase